MSSDQFSEKPLPPGRKRCPYCGEILKSTDEVCWLCQQKVGVQEGLPDVSPRQLSDLHRRRSSGESAVRAICKHSQACRRYSLLVATQSPPRESSGRLPPAPMDYNNNMLNWFRKLQDISGCLAFRLCNEA